MSVRVSAAVVPGLILGMVILLGGCAPARAVDPGPATGAEESFNDPFENTNRAIFSFNEDVDRAAILPAAKAYRAVLPAPVRDSVRDFLRNLNGPIIFANDALQAQFGLAGKTAARFAINSTLGVGGLVDLAGRWGIPYHSDDFGITLAVWGMPSGPYIVVPILGPSYPRAVVGQVADGFADPGNIVLSNNDLLFLSFVREAVAGIDERERNIDSLADLKRTSLDFYATIRSLYQQRRAAQIRHEDENMPNPSPGFGDSGGGASPASLGRPATPPSRAGGAPTAPAPTAMTAPAASMPGASTPAASTPTALMPAAPTTRYAAPPMSYTQSPQPQSPQPESK
jgi:phospholipid-binding lipoprotein MlaA